MKTVRDTKRGSRRANAVPSVAIAGYTNAGKSSHPQPAHRRGRARREPALRDPRPHRAPRRDRPTAALYTLADTVGFVRALPHQLVEAFRSTLEEVAEADLLLHVVDGSHPDPEGQISAVRTVLADVDATDVREVIVINKADLADPEVIDRLRRHEKHSIVVSARTGAGLDELRALIADELPQPDVDVDVLVPYDRGDLVSRIHETGEVLASEHVADGDPDAGAGPRPTSRASSRPSPSDRRRVPDRGAPRAGLRGPIPAGTLATVQPAPREMTTSAPQPASARRGGTGPCGSACTVTRRSTRTRRGRCPRATTPPRPRLRPTAWTAGRAPGSTTGSSRRRTPARASGSAGSAAATSTSTVSRCSTSTTGWPRDRARTGPGRTRRPGPGRPTRWSGCPTCRSW